MEYWLGIDIIYLLFVYFALFICAFPLHHLFCDLRCFGAIRTEELDCMPQKCHAPNVRHSFIMPSVQRSSHISMGASQMSSSVPSSSSSSMLGRRCFSQHIFFCSCKQFIDGCFTMYLLFQAVHQWVFHNISSVPSSPSMRVLQPIFCINGCASSVQRTLLIWVFYNATFWLPISCSIIYDHWSPPSQ